MVMFGTLQTDGTLVNVRHIEQSNMKKCPFFIMAPEHYREDGTCLCNDDEHRKKVMCKWGYRKRDFVKAGVIK